MDKNLYEFKISLLNSGLFRRVSDVQYKCQECPICGDKRWHCYVKIDVNSDTPVLFNCFKHNCHGIVGQQFVDYFNLRINVPKFKHIKQIDVSQNVSVTLPPINVSGQDDITDISEYVQTRVGHTPSLGELQIFNYIGNPRKYTIDYLGNDDPQIIKDRYWFKMTNGNIIGRLKDDTSNMRWLKYKSTNIKTAGLYKFALPVDLYQQINVIIAEGIFDLIGLYYNYHGCENNVYIATLGKSYIKGIEYMIDKGLFGDSVNIKIFKDADVSKIWIDNKYRQLFKRIDIYENISSKDYGVTPDKMDVHRIIERK